METIKYTGKLQRYFRAPIYMIILFVAGDVLVYLQNIKAGAWVGVWVMISSEERRVGKEWRCGWAPDR